MTTLTMTRVIAARKPAVPELDVGTYYWCRCGRSANQPFCDGSHKVTGITPLAFTIDKRKRVALCRCKRTKKEPFCDDTHRSLT